jgi:L-fucose isomerase-like protein
MKIALFFISRKRPGFDREWGMFLEQEIRSQLQQSPFEPFFFGPIADEPALKKSIAAAHHVGVEAVIVTQPTMGDGNLFPVLLSEWDCPVIIWATPENPNNPKVSACGLVGAHNWVSGMSQAGKPPLLVIGLPGNPETVTELNETVQIAATSKKIRHAHVGLIGDHAPGFLNMAVDAVAMQQLLGTRLKRIGLHEFCTITKSFSDSEVADDRKKAESRGLPIRSGVTFNDDVYDISSRYYLAVKQIAEEESLDAIALRCWSELPNEFGVWSYWSIARLVSDGINICEEGDVDGAIGCLIARSLGSEIAAFNSDWLEHDDESITLWHAGATPFEICEPFGSPHAPTLSVHFNNGKPVVVEARLQSDIPVTLFRLWRFRNEYRLAICEGRTVIPTREIAGCSGRVLVSGGGVKKFFLDACYAGMPHHVTVVKGHFASKLKRLANHHQPKPIHVVLQIGQEEST